MYRIIACSAPTKFYALTWVTLLVHDDVEHQVPVPGSSQIKHWQDLGSKTTSVHYGVHWQCTVWVSFLQFKKVWFTNYFHNLLWFCDTATSRRFFFFMSDTVAISKLPTLHYYMNLQLNNYSVSKKHKAHFVSINVADHWNVFLKWKWHDDISTHRPSLSLHHVIAVNNFHIIEF